MAPHNFLSPQAVCQCRRKNCGQLDIFPTRDAYHPMSEYPTYHTHGRYVAPGSAKRSPYEEVRTGPTGGVRQRLWLGRGSEGALGEPKELGRVERRREVSSQGLARTGVEVRRVLGERPGEETTEER